MFECVSKAGSLKGFLSVFLLVQLFQKSDAAFVYTAYGKATDITTFAGDGGKVTAASLRGPSATWLNTDGEGFISETFRIRKVDTSGIIQTYGGTGSSTSSGDGGPATSAGVNNQYLFGDSVGNVYFNDNVRNTIRKIDTSLIISTFAGGGSQTKSGVYATSTSLNQPTSLFVVATGDVYFLDSSRAQILKASVATNIITIIAGTGGSPNQDTSDYNGDGGPASSALLQSPWGLFMDTNDFLYFGSAYLGHVRKIDLVSGIITNFAGGTFTYGYGGDGGPATSALLLASGCSLAGDGFGSVYYSSSFDFNVRVIDTSGIINRYAGGPTTKQGNSGDGGEATAALFGAIANIFIKDIDMYVTDKGYNVIRYIVMDAPSSSPTAAPSTSIGPSVTPSVNPTAAPSVSDPPTAAPSLTPSDSPTEVPSSEPTTVPSLLPSLIPSHLPTIAPTLKPTHSPTLGPSFEPSVLPTQSPSELPTVAPSAVPSVIPSITVPTINPTTIIPSRKPTARPSVRPTRASVTVSPTLLPTVSPTAPIVVISFNSDVTLSNVTASSLDVTSQSAVTSSVAVTLNISSSQVSYVSQQLVGSGGRRVLRTAGVDVYQIEVTVNVVASTADFVDAVNHNGTYLYHLLTDTLTAAVESNAFTRTVREQSAALRAVSTLYVGHVNVTVSDFTDVTPAVAQHHTSDLNGGEYAGIVIGIVVSFMMVMFACWYGVSVSRQKAIE